MTSVIRSVSFSVLATCFFCISSNLNAAGFQIQTGLSGETVTSSSGPSTISDIIKQDGANGTTRDRPSSGYYYMTIWATPDGAAKIPTTTCTDRSFWSFARKFAGIKRGAAAILMVTVTPKGGQAVTVPVFQTSASEISAEGKGSNCSSEFSDRGLTFTYNSNVSPSFDIDLAFYFSNEVQSKATQNALSGAAQLMTLIDAASGGSAALATKLADPALNALAAKVDAEITNHWSSDDRLKFHTSFNPTANFIGTASIVRDKITFRMPVPTATAGGVSLSNWDAGGSIYLRYQGEKFKTDGKWQDSASIMATVLVPSSSAGAQTNLDKIILNGDAVDGFNRSSLVSPTDAGALRDACGKLKSFLASFLVPNDALAARYAVLENSAYALHPALRGDSACFSDSELSLLATGSNNEFIFSTQERGTRDKDDTRAKMDPLASAFAAGNKIKLREHLVSPLDDLSITLGKSDGDYYRGEDAVAKLVELRLSCYQARPDNDLSSIAALVKYGATKTGAILSFDSGGKLKELTLMDVDTVSELMKIDKTKWLNNAGTDCR
jgi:hypothetical protein